ncbi:hypothetical protein SAMN03080594_106132 [Arenibacter palladensis]|uniref:Uncharacterized protein n=1 Tax=Arenibacter palladensis TaxID=237373 RepID=A0A1M5DKK4_9FLAO|nr:hypothetical protein SAMN03080594_106132 [Arenibacter palladensis]
MSDLPTLTYKVVIESEPIKIKLGGKTSLNL